jgi:hypothetical protein
MRFPRLRLSVRRAMIAIAVAAIGLAVVRVRTQFCWHHASEHAFLEAFHAREAAQAKSLWQKHQTLARERAAQFAGSDNAETRVALDPAAKTERIEALFQRYTMGYNIQMAQWHASEKKRFEEAARYPSIFLPQELSPPPIVRPRRQP